MIRKAKLPARKEYEIVGGVLGDARRELGLTQRELSRKLGRPLTTVGKIESGSQRLDVVELFDIAKALRISALDLTGRFAAAFADADEASTE